MTIEQAAHLGCPKHILDRIKRLNIISWSMYQCHDVHKIDWNKDINWKLMERSSEIFSQRDEIKAGLGFKKPEPVKDRWEILDL